MDIFSELEKFLTQGCCSRPEDRKYSRDRDRIIKKNKNNFSPRADEGSKGKSRATIVSTPRKSSLYQEKDPNSSEKFPEPSNDACTASVTGVNPLVGDSSFANESANDDSEKYLI